MVRGQLRILRGGQEAPPRRGRRATEAHQVQEVRSGVTAGSCLLRLSRSHLRFPCRQCRRCELTLFDVAQILAALVGSTAGKFLRGAKACGLVADLPQEVSDAQSCSVVCRTWPASLMTSA